MTPGLQKEDILQLQILL